MKIHYEFRFIYAMSLSLVIIFLDFLYDIYPLFKQIDSLKQAKKELVLKLKKIKKPSIFHSVLIKKDKLYLYNELIGVVQSYGLHMVEMQMDGQFQSEKRIINFVIEGEPYQFYNFISKLGEFNNHILIKNFLFKTKNNYLIAKLNIVFFNNEYLKTTKYDENKSNNRMNHLFCLPQLIINTQKYEKDVS